MTTTKDIDDVIFNAHVEDHYTRFVSKHGNAMSLADYRAKYGEQIEKHLVASAATISQKLSNVVVTKGELEAKFSANLLSIQDQHLRFRSPGTGAEHVGATSLTKALTGAVSSRRFASQLNSRLQRFSGDGVLIGDWLLSTVADINSANLDDAAAEEGPLAQRAFDMWQGLTLTSNNTPVTDAQLVTIMIFLQQLYDAIVVIRTQNPSLAPLPDQPGRLDTRVAARARSQGNTVTNTLIQLMSRNANTEGNFSAFMPVAVIGAAARIVFMASFPQFRAVYAILEGILAAAGSGESTPGYVAVTIVQNMPAHYKKAIEHMNEENLRLMKELRDSNLYAVLYETPEAPEPPQRDDLNDETVAPPSVSAVKTMLQQPTLQQVAAAAVAESPLPVSAPPRRRRAPNVMVPASAAVDSVTDKHGTRRGQVCAKASAINSMVIPHLEKTLPASSARKATISMIVPGFVSADTKMTWSEASDKERSAYLAAHTVESVSDTGVFTMMNGDKHTLTSNQYVSKMLLMHHDGDSAPEGSVASGLFVSPAVTHSLGTCTLKVLSTSGEFVDKKTTMSAASKKLGAAKKKAQTEAKKRAEKALAQANKKKKAAVDELKTRRNRALADADTLKDKAERKASKTTESAKEWKNRITGKEYSYSDIKDKEKLLSYMKENSELLERLRAQAKEEQAKGMKAAAKQTRDRITQVLKHQAGIINQQRALSGPNSPMVTMTELVEKFMPAGEELALTDAEFGELVGATAKGLSDDQLLEKWRSIKTKWSNDLLPNRENKSYSRNMEKLLAQTRTELQNILKEMLKRNLAVDKDLSFMVECSTCGGHSKDKKKKKKKKEEEQEEDDDAPLSGTLLSAGMDQNIGLNFGGKKKPGLVVMTKEGNGVYLPWKERVDTIEKFRDVITSVKNDRTLKDKMVWFRQGRRNQGGMLPIQSFWYSPYLNKLYIQEKPAFNMESTVVRPLSFTKFVFPGVPETDQAKIWLAGEEEPAPKAPMYLGISESAPAYDNELIDEDEMDPDMAALMH